MTMNVTQLLSEFLSLDSQVKLEMLDLQAMIQTLQDLLKDKKDLII